MRRDEQLRILFWRNRTEDAGICKYLECKTLTHRRNDSRTEWVVSLNTPSAYETLHFKCVPTRCVTTMVPTIKKPGYVYQLYICICDHRNEHVRRDIAGKLLALFKLYVEVETEPLWRNLDYWSKNGESDNQRLRCPSY